MIVFVQQPGRKAPARSRKSTGSLALSTSTSSSSSSSATTRKARRSSSAEPASKPADRGSSKRKMAYRVENDAYRNDGVAPADDREANTIAVDKHDAGGRDWQLD